MFQRKPSAVAQQVRRYLTEERRLIENGRFDEIERLVSRKEDAIAGLRGVTLSPDDLTALRDEAARNQLLLEAAMTGVRSAIGRIEGFRKARAGLTTYDPTGKRRAGEPAATGLSRRA